MWTYSQGGTEPTLDELIHEPAIRLLMERDNVTEEALLRIITIACCALIAGATSEKPVGPPP